MIQVTFKGADITDSISINACYHDMYCEKQSDTLLIRFNDTENLWDQWQPKVGDEIAVTYGSVRTGNMFVFDVTPKNGLYEIEAASVPPSVKEVKNKAWQKISLMKIAAEIANNHELYFESYGVENNFYQYVVQENKTDLYFLQKRCELEGCAFLVYDGKLILYSETYMERQQPAEIIPIGIDDNYRYQDNTARLYGYCCIEKGNFRGSFESGDGLARVYTPQDAVMMSSMDEANRFAKNLLRMVNKDTKTGYVKGRIMPAYAAASMAKLQNERAPSWDGNVFITHIRNDYANGKTKICFRKPLEGY